MIEYVKGDATQPVGGGAKILVHCCNNVGAWGAGFVLALSKRYPEPEREYREWARTGELLLGFTQFVEVSPMPNVLVVANLIGQHGIEGRSPIRYDAIDQGLASVAYKADQMFATVHMPRMGCGLAGGDWRVIEALIHKNLTDNDIPVFVYDPKEV